MKKGLRAVPLTRAEANEVVARWHRHHKPVHAHKYAIGAVDRDDRIVGAVIVGNPITQKYDRHEVAEVLRLVTDGTRNACSFLYARAAEAARAMGYRRIQTYILEHEPGTSLRATGWYKAGLTTGGDRDHRPGRVTPDHLRGPKQRWVRDL